MLTEEAKELADKVSLAYAKAQDGGLHKWAGMSALRDRMKYPEWSTGYIGSVHSIILAVICRMVEEGFLTLNESEVT